MSSIYSPVSIEQELSFLIIGERTNANGSKAFREAMLAGDWDGCVKMANEQVREGAHVLDVCVDYVGRDGALDMDEIAKRFATQASVPLVMDSTEANVLEAGLQHIGGRPILNSANLEDGELPGSRFDKVMTLAREYGAAVICLLIDERGQARDVEWKMEIAHRIHEIATERYGLAASDLIFDALTFPLSTGDDDLRKDAIYTMEAIRRIKAEIPGAHTTLGVSNVSFGLNPPARHALNSVFLHECVQAGLDSAIVHAGKIVPLNRLPDDQREVCLDLVYDRRTDTYDPLQELLEVFADVKSTKTEKVDRSGQPVEERLHHRIIDGDRDGLTGDLDEALAGMPALAIVNDVLLGGMKVVGELFGSGQMQLPFVLQSAETMKTAVAYLEPHMEKVGGSSAKGKLVLATVKGDVHDIGKNLVDIICTNNGYEVHNLGIKVAIGEMVAKAKEVEADAIGMSGLLVKSTLIMRENLEELNSLGLSDLPVLLGGAALTRRYVERDLREVYEGRLFYGRDAFEGLSTLDSLMTMKRSGEWDPDFGTVPTGRELPERSSDTAPAVELPRRSPDVASDNPVFTPPFVGARVVKGIPLDDIAEFVNETALFRNQWQFRPEKLADGRPESDDEFKARIRPCSASSSPPPRRQGCSCRRSCTGTSPPTATATTSSCGRTKRDPPRRPASTTRARRSPRSCASPTSSARSSRVSSTTPPSTSSRWAPRSVRPPPGCSPPTSTSSTCCCTASASRWPKPWPSTGTAASARSGASSTRTVRRSAASSASSTAAVATRGATRRARTSRTTPPSPSCSTPTASASRCRRRPAGSTSPSRRPRRSSATTRRPSTSSPAELGSTAGARWPGRGLERPRRAPLRSSRCACAPRRSASPS